MRRAAGDLTAADLAAIVHRLAEDRRRWELVPLSGSLLASAEGLIQRYPLRPPDAIHLAAALTFKEMSGLRVPFVTADARQQEAGEPAGLSVLWAG